VVKNIIVFFSNMNKTFYL